jgi:hypothetical protein
LASPSPGVNSQVKDLDGILGTHRMMADVNVQCQFSGLTEILVPYSWIDPV